MDGAENDSDHEGASLSQSPNLQQQEAIDTLDGPVLIVAGPGSGKTFCLVERTANLLASRDVAPERVLISTFTEKAAKELMFLFPQYGAIRATREGMQLDVWAYFDRCLGDFIAHLKSGADEQIAAWVKDKAKQHLTLSENTNYSFASLFYDLIQFPTFSRYLGEDLAHAGVRDSRPARNLAKFSRLLNKYEYLYNVIILQPERLERDLLTLFNYFLRFLWDGGIEEYEDEAEYAPSGCVSFMTIHQSKGLEFPIVVAGSLDAVPRRQQSPLDDLLQAEFSDGERRDPAGHAASAIKLDRIAHGEAMRGPVDVVGRRRAEGDSGHIGEP